MEMINDFNEEDFAKLKIFLVTNFNIQFFNEPNTAIKESFEITTNDGTIIGHFFSEGVLELTFDEKSKHHYEIIYSFIKKLNKQDIDNQPSEYDLSLEVFNDFLSNSRIFFDHISKCDICKTKFSEILKHIQ